MNVAALLKEFDDLGILVSPNGDRLQVDAPCGVVNDRLRHELKIHKPDILSFLRRAEAEKALDLIRERGYVPVKSGSLDGQIVLFVRDEPAQIPDRWDGTITYTLSELENLRGCDIDTLRRVHEIKQIFGGRVADDIPIDQMQDPGGTL